MLGWIVFTALLITSIIILIVKYHQKRKPDFLIYQNKWFGKHRGLKALLIIFLVSGVFLTSLNVTTRTFFYRSSPNINGNFRWMKSNTQEYLEVTAEDRYSLGYLEGRGLAKQIINFRSAILTSGLIYWQKSYSIMVDEAKLYLPAIPQEYQTEMQGMADGASFQSGQYISFEDILLQNVYLDLSYGRWLPILNESASGEFGCTDVGARNPDGSIIMGQNFDYSKILDHDSMFPSMSFVHLKFAGKTEMFGLRFGGMLALPVMKTANNITVVVTVIETNILTNYSMPAVVVARYAFENTNKAEDLIRIVFDEYERNVGFTILAKNQTHLIGIQSHPLGYRINENATIVNSNCYAYPDWNEEILGSGDYSKTRQKYTERLLKDKTEDGELTYEELLEILGTTEDGFEGEKSAPCYDQGLMGDATLAVFTERHFALGNVHDGLGVIPI
jgi:hypothetical protein